MALRLSEQRLRLAPDPPPAAGSAAEPAAERADDGDRDLGAPFPGEEPGGGTGDFYADAMDTA